MIEAGGPSTSEFSGMLSQVAGCARPTGGSHGLTTRGPAQRFKGKAKAAPTTRCEKQRGQGHYKARALQSPSLLSERFLEYEPY